MISIYKAASSAADEYHKEFNGKKDLVSGANIAGFMKVADAMMAQGIV